MSRNLRKISPGGAIILMLVLINAVILKYSLPGEVNLYWLLLITVPLLIIAIANRRQTKHTILRNYPLIGYLRYWMESLRPEIRQYFFESDTDGKPFSRRQRSIVYQRAKNESQTIAFGMQGDPDKPGYEWLAHSMFPVRVETDDLRVTIGNDQCLQPYSASILNIGAMSYGALSRTAVEALNCGARDGCFAHNTGEGGISPYHLKGGDLIWQIGTGYFGCRDEQGYFDLEAFRKEAQRPEVKMIELKISQGAKPGHGGILPAVKNTSEIASIRKIPAHTRVESPAGHSAFRDAEGMLLFLQSLREGSLGKPVGFKICVGSKKEFREICYYMRKTEIFPDFITIDGAEGGTGAAPMEFSDHVGMPLFEGLSFATKTLEHYQLKHHIKIFAAGKIITGFDILKTLALGADACYSSRGMMFALGCIQALQCDSAKCPVGVATQDPIRYQGLDIRDKKFRVTNFHRNTIHATKELMEACGFRKPEEISVSSFFRKLSVSGSVSLEKIYGLRKSEKKLFNHNIN